MSMGKDAAVDTAADVLLVGARRGGVPADRSLWRRGCVPRGLRVAVPLTERPMGAQMKRAERLKARFALFVGEAELARGTFGLKDLKSGEQVEVAEAGIVAAAPRKGRAMAV